MGDALDADAVSAWIGTFVAAFRVRRAELDELDRRGGDGDFGSNLLPSLERATAGLEGARDASVPFAALSGGFMAAGGTSGPLFGVYIREFARAAAGVERFELGSLAAAAAAGADAVRRLGGAQAGDKTMVDAMAPAADALEHAAAAGESLTAALAAAAAAARAGAEDTAAMVARRGRASYVGEASRGAADAGAVAVALFYEAAGAVTPAVA